MTPERFQIYKEKVARLRARRLRQLARFLTDTARESTKAMYADRVMSEEYQKALTEIHESAWNISDIVVPRNPETGYADARKLFQAVLSHAFRPQIDTDSSTSAKIDNGLSGRQKYDDPLRNAEPRK